MVKRILLLLLYFWSLSIGSNSGRIAKKAAKAMNNGSYELAWSYYQNALRSSIGEGNKNRELAIRLNMSHILTRLGHYSLADSVIQTVLKEKSISPLLSNHAQASAQLLQLLQGKSSKCSSPVTNEDLLEDLPSSSQMRLYYHQVKCALLSENASLAAEILDDLPSSVHKKSKGKFHLYSARTLSQQGKHEDALILYLKSFNLLQKNTDNFMIGALLWEMAQEYKSLNQQKMALDFLRRSLLVFEKARIPLLVNKLLQEGRSLDSKFYANKELYPSEFAPIPSLKLHFHVH